MNIKIQSESISFKEFAEEHPDKAVWVPDSHGLDGTTLYQILLPFALEVLKDIIAYIAKRTIENKEKKKKKKEENIIFILKDGKALCIPLADFGNIDCVLRRIENEVGKNTD